VASQRQTHCEREATQRLVSGVGFEPIGEFSFCAPLFSSLCFTVQVPPSAISGERQVVSLVRARTGKHTLPGGPIPMATAAGEGSTTSTTTTTSLTPWEAINDIFRTATKRDLPVLTHLQPYIWQARLVG
jgi:hypothetical protein